MILEHNSSSTPCVQHNHRRKSRSRIHIHISLLDINAGVLARDIYIMMLLYDLSERQMDSTVQCEIQATIFYTFAGIAIKTRLLKRPAQLPQ